MDSPGLQLIRVFALNSFAIVCTNFTTGKLWPKFTNEIKLCFGDHLKSANTGKSCNIGESSQNSAVIFLCYSFLHLFIQQVNILS